MSEPRYVDVVPRRPVRLDARRLRAYWQAGGRSLLWDEVRRSLVEEVGRRGSCPEEVAALRAYVDLEVPETFAYLVERFED